ncbi:MAG: hypothetical protein JWM64_2703 [Frankiales bacterium]|nr:hypothetical protein [Frankiales bacterium]
MNPDPRYADLLAHHALVQALPGVIPMVVLVSVFVGIVVADRRKHRGDAPEADLPPTPDADQAR